MKITTKHTTAIAHLIEGVSLAETARLVGVSTRSMTRWHAEPTFVLALADARAAVRQQIVTTLASKAQGAIDVLETLMNGGEGIPAIVRYRAASDLLNRVVGNAATTELEQKVAELQEMMGQINEYS